MRHLVLLAALAVVAAQAPARAAAQKPTTQLQAPAAPAPLTAEAQLRSDTLARAALAATVERKRVFVDVRTPAEFAAGHLPGALNLPLDQLEQRWTELKAYPRRQIVLYCRSGHRAGLALDSLKQHGIVNVVNGGGFESLRRLLASAQ